MKQILKIALAIIARHRCFSVASILPIFCRTLPSPGNIRPESPRKKLLPSYTQSTMIRNDEKKNNPSPLSILFLLSCSFSTLNLSLPTSMMARDLEFRLIERSSIIVDFLQSIEGSTIKNGFDKVLVFTSPPLCSWHLEQIENNLCSIFDKKAAPLDYCAIF